MEEVIVSQDWWVPLLGTIASALGAGLLYLVRRLVNRLIEKIDASEADKEAIQYLLEGMNKAQDEIVRKAKEVSDDGKLTEKEMMAARELAVMHAKSVAKGTAKKVLDGWSAERTASVIKQLLESFKKVK